MGNQVKILLVQTANSNLGDNVIADNHAYLINKISGGNAKIFHYSIASRDVEQIRFVDAVIFAGGILKVTNEKFHEYIPEIIRKAQEYQVPVYLSNIGVEKFYEDNESSCSLKETLNLPCVKGIAVRDDIDTLKKDYLTRDDLEITPCWDIAVWSKDTYHSLLPSSYSPKKNDVIGLGIVRHKLFPDYGHPEITHEMQLDYWTAIIRELETRGYKWVLFTNGDVYDEEMAQEVLAAVGHGEKKETPLDGEALVRTISGLQGCIAGRMHSNIISYSLGIPSIGFIWNQKLRFWAEKIQHPERFFECEDLDPIEAINRLEAALREDNTPKKEYKEAIYSGLENFIHKYVQKPLSSKQSATLDFKKILCADHLGSLRTRYPQTNSEEALLSSLREGYRFLEADIRLTKDRVLVCVDRWHKDTYHLLGIDSEKLDKPGNGLSCNDFLSRRYYNRFTPITFNDLISKLLKKYYKADIVLSFGRPEKEHLFRIISWIRTSKYCLLYNKKHFIFRGERLSDLLEIKKALPHSQLMYYFVPDKVMKENAGLLESELKKAIDMCAENGIHYIALRDQFYQPAYINQAHQKGIKFCLLTDSKIHLMLDSVEAGADLIFNQTYPISYLSDLTK